MTEQEMIRAAQDMGFANVALIDTGRLVFLSKFRPLCQENLCGKYGANYACPPDCGTVEEMKAQVLAYPRGLVLQTMWNIDDPMDETQTKPAKKQHNRMTLDLRQKLGQPSLMVGASGCSLCDPCAIVGGAPCRFPDKRFSCMSAYCIFVRDLCDHCGMEYDCGPGVVAFFSMLCFGGEA